MTSTNNVESCRGSAATDCLLDIEDAVVSGLPIQLTDGRERDVDGQWLRSFSSIAEYRDRMF
jgi:hypothetical protein